MCCCYKQVLPGLWPGNGRDEGAAGPAGPALQHQGGQQHTVGAYHQQGAKGE